MYSPIAPIEEVINTLGTFLRKEVPRILEFHDEFPAANRKLKMPQLTGITSGTGELTPFQNEILSICDIKGETVFKTVKYTVGQYSIPIQLDLWCRNKKERNSIFELLFQALTSQDVLDEPQVGVILELTDYHGVKCHYNLGNYNIDDSGSASQRREWRVKIDVMATVKAVTTRKQPIIVTTEVQSEIKESGSITE